MQKLICLVLLVACVAAARSEAGCYSQPEEPNSNPCTYTRCGWGATCRNENGIAKCECPSVCAAIYQPVCGSDGQTYSNSCQLDVSNCENQKSVTIDREGSCEEQ